MAQNVKNASNFSKESNNEKVYTSKVNGLQLTEAELSDLLNESSSIKKSNSNADYNYRKIADNLLIICQIIGYGITSDMVADIEKDKKNFVECKTKAKLSSHPEFSTVKSRIRMKVREFMANKEISEKAKQTLKKFIF